MKILADASSSTYDSKFIVEMSADEIAKAAGFQGAHDSAFKEATHRRLVGTEIKVSTAYDYHHRVRQHQNSAVSAANTLRALAELIGGALPEVVIPPVDPDFAEVEEGGAK